MVNESPDARPRRRLRPTRRGKIVLVVAALLVVSAAVLIPLSLIGPDEQKKESPQSTLVIPEGWRASQVYAAVDRALGLKPGSARKTVTTVDLDLPDQAEGNPEGYLFPATYPIDSATEPAGLLRYMADTARKRFGADHITAGAQRNNVTVYETATIASIVQAEADTASDMGKVARVVYNRLLKDMPLQMDSTINYALKRSTLDTSTADTQLDSPYNSYVRKGLPPTPIGNPGEEALRAAISPTPGPWLYFVTVAPGDTRFTDSYDEQLKNVEEFNRNRRSAAAG
ncbi:endolytic transglycosylase MltG [Streptomyces microflavus]|uniref:Endolytic murein transglycosylase n=1 Tax=Streptomyces microflavus TaxID=1919 RepID=A0A7H8MHH7_STRMI|nr:MULTISPECIES: endolytic transglycosylase MltG [Streptomyces]MBK5990502.1 endolytic transglycosylase MltG [Streptomyces sp. MBT58]MBW3357256.1 endolytic transglycosylase MltG [Streptomyces sp. 09ZI22]MCX4650922.1 endolytic transglycosylase MltG [Streptomyces microflavus]MDX2977584.1 endolytic transglycosylase MltG [Streptomyces sp. NRRL_B-2249]QKW41648.1 endolytic transglycosylase MltG [Streptomyces microflavus]